ELEWFHGADHDFYNATYFFFNHSAHHLHAIHKDEEVYQYTENQADHSRQHVCLFGLFSASVEFECSDGDGCFQPFVVAFGDRKLFEFTYFNVLLHLLFDSPLDSERWLLFENELTRFAV